MLLNWKINTLVSVHPHWTKVADMIWGGRQLGVGQCQGEGSGVRMQGEEWDSAWVICHVSSMKAIFSIEAAAVETDWPIWKWRIQVQNTLTPGKSTNLQIDITRAAVKYILIAVEGQKAAIHTLNYSFWCENVINLTECHCSLIQ